MSNVTLTLSIDEANLLFHVFADETCEQREIAAPDLEKYESLDELIGLKDWLEGEMWAIAETLKKAGVRVDEIREDA